MLTIPLVGGAANAHQIFFVQLGDNFLEFRLNFITRSIEDGNFAPWVVDIYREGVLLAAGVALVPGSDLIEFYNLDIGKLYFTGDFPTLNNLGESNELVWSDE